MKKVLHTLAIDYPSEITEITFPAMLRYAAKIDAAFNVISDRKFERLPVIYEKMQLFELGADNDWNIFVDADTFIHPDMFDVTEHLSKDTVLFYGTDVYGTRFAPNAYSRRDGRGIAPGSWFIACSNWTLDLFYHSLEDVCDKFGAIHAITPLEHERAAGVTSESLLDDYCMAQNIARFGLKVETLAAMSKRLGTGLHQGFDPSRMFFHDHTITDKEKIVKLRIQAGLSTVGS